MVNSVYVVQAELGKNFTGHAEAVKGIEEDIPLMGIAQSKGIGTQKGGGGNICRPNRE